MAEQIVRDAPGIGRTISKTITTIERSTPNILAFESRLMNVETEINNINISLAQKLNSSEYTAANILSKIKTVDGHNSALDADTVDGLHASSFLSITGKAADANLLDGKDSSYYANLESGAITSDPNYTVLPNMLTLHNNAPAGGYWHITTTFYSSITSSSNRGQMAIEYLSASPRMFIRSSYSGVWSTWIQCDGSGSGGGSVPTTLYAVGTYMFAIETEELHITNPGGTRAGSYLRPASLSLTIPYPTATGGVLYDINNALPGVWRCMGYSHYGNVELYNQNNNDETFIPPVTLWLRIS